jgi:anti-anti-sigma regulatory factor
MNQNADLLVMKIEGQLKGEYAEHTRTVVTCCNPALRLLVDLREVTFVDTAGEEVLSLLARLGARFMAENTYTRHLCERLRLPLTRIKSH